MSQTKSFYDPANHRYTSEARICDDEIFKALRPLMDKYLALGYGPREIAHLMINAVGSLESNAVLEND